jgi:hypothetical protein
VTRHRYALALGAGALAYVLILYRFLSYSERNRLPGDMYLLFLAATMGIGFLVTLGACRRFRTATFVPLGVCLAHLIVVIVDVARDPSAHNLAPFEFVLLFVCAAPAYVGAVVAWLVDRLRGNRPGAAC